MKKFPVKAMPVLEYVRENAEVPDLVHLKIRSENTKEAHPVFTHEEVLTGFGARTIDYCPMGLCGTARKERPYERNSFADVVSFNTKQVEAFGNWWDGHRTLKSATEAAYFIWPELKEQKRRKK